MQWIFVVDRKMMIYDFSYSYIQSDLLFENKHETKQNYVTEIIETDHVKKIRQFYIFSTNQNTRFVTIEGYYEHNIIKVWTKNNSKYYCSLTLCYHTRCDIIGVKNDIIYCYAYNEIKMLDINTGIEKCIISDTDIISFSNRQSVIIIYNGDIIFEMLTSYFSQIVIIHFINSTDFIKRVIDANTSYCCDIQLLPDHRLIAGFNESVIKIYDFSRFMLNLCHNSNDLKCNYNEMNFSKKIQVICTSQNYKFIIYEDKRLITLHSHSTMFVWK